VNDPIQVLKAGLCTVRHHTIGWLKEALMIDGKLNGSKEKFYAKMFVDYNAQKIYIRAQQDIMGEEFNPLKVMPGRDEQGQFSFTKNVDVPKNHLSLAYLLLVHAYDVSESTFKRSRLREGAPLEKQIHHNKGQSVLLHADYAATICTLVYFYVQHQMKKWLPINPQVSADRKSSQHKTFRKVWEAELRKTRIQVSVQFSKNNHVTIMLVTRVLRLS
jgi:hypothetical protein